MKGETTGTRSALGLLALLLAAATMVVVVALPLRTVWFPPDDPTTVEFWVWQLEKGNVGMQRAAPGVLSVKLREGSERSDEACEALIRALDYSDAAVRFASVGALANDKRASGRIQALATGDPDPAVREIANAALAGRLFPCRDSLQQDRRGAPATNPVRQISDGAVSGE